MLKIKYIILYFLLFFVAACSEKVLSEQQLVGVISEIYLTEAVLNRKGISLESPKAMEYYEQALKKHHITMAEYQQSILFYAEKKPDELNAIFDNAVKRLELTLKGIEKDSIRSLYVEPQKTDTLTQE